MDRSCYSVGTNLLDAFLPAVLRVGGESSGDQNRDEMIVKNKVREELTFCL